MLLSLTDALSNGSNIPVSITPVEHATYRYVADLDFDNVAGEAISDALVIELSYDGTPLVGT